MSPAIGIGIGTSFGGSSWVPTKLSGNVLWLRADLGVTTVTSDVSQQLDQSPSGVTWEQGTAGDRPTLTSADADFGGQASITYTAAEQDGLDLATPGSLASTSNDYTFICVHKSATADDGASHVIFDGGTSPYSPPDRLGFAWGFGGVNKLGALVGGSYLSVTGSAQTTAVRYDTWVLDSVANTLEVFEDGASAGTVGYTTDTELDTGTVGRIGCDVSDLRHYGGKVAEMIMYDRALNAGELARVWTYIQSRYGL